MKTLRNIIASLTLIFFAAGFALNFSACTEQSPLQVNVTEKNDISPNNQIHFLPLGISDSSLKKVTKVSKWVTVQYGGLLNLLHTGNGISVNSTLYILPGTISQDAEVSLTLDDENFIGSLDLVFEPHGITFSQPALLTIVASGLDLSGFDPDKLDIYYYDEATGNWERMQRDAFIVEPYTGSIIVQNARLPHFSRYAIGAE